MSQITTTANMDSSLVSTPFQSLDNLSSEDRRLFNLFGCGKLEPPPYTVVHHAFEAVAAAHPDAIAVRQHDGASITYGELDRRANILANKLRGELGMKAGDRVILAVSRSIEMVVFIFAALKAGGQYVPVDGGVVPVETLAHQITDSGASIVLCLPKHQAKVEQSISASHASGVEVVSLQHSDTLWTTGDDGKPNVDVRPENGAYVIYTSGTTGKPKGVDVVHSGVTHMLLVDPPKLGITVGTKVAQQLNVGFDMCAWEVLATLMNGGTLCTRGSGDDNWLDCLRRVDVVISTPTIALARFPRPEDFPNLKTIAVGGEPCPKALADCWAPHANFFNVCGPTEISILNTAHLHKQGGPLTIGKPNPNTSLYILDEDENPVKIGEPGVMWVGGAGVSRGYLNLPELAAKRFRPDKFTKNGAMMFNTGDIGRWLPDGSIETLGRRDDQVKINGFRVELDGVSRAIEAHPAVVKACALNMGGKLWGFYSAPADIDAEDLKGFVGNQQPYYAVPAVWRHISSIPLTPNGKTDKRTLRELAAMETTNGISSSSSSSSDNLGKLEVDEMEMPPRRESLSGWRWLRHSALSAYRKLFAVILTANVVAFAVMLWQSRGNNFELPLSSLATAVGANLLASVLLRQDYVVNAVFWLATRLPTSTPLSIRRHFARVYHYGGVHSGCSVAASLWWLVFTVASTARLTSQPRLRQLDVAVLTLTYLILALLAAILAMAYPSIRTKLHDQFEWTHRFAGWTALALVWAHLVLVAASQTPPHHSLPSALARTPALYLVALATLSIALPWTRLRRVPVVPEPLSAHAVRLHFDFATPRPCASLGVRITDRPLVEWHAFAAIPSPDGAPGFSILVSKAGDWTSRIIRDPPTSLWTRGAPASGVLAIAPLFAKIVLVATGSGIGPCLPVIMERRVPCRILWSTKDPVKTYGRGVVDEVRRADAEAVVWDTEKRGRPDLARLAWRLYRESGAECVCVISNAKTTKRVVFELEARGIPAFGPIWDS
ncbi:putative Nonribosomal peptide synthetase [Podospora conica]|nr:putative Nonribosomal peptide synthetase [Schizothecium conicum]